MTEQAAAWTGLRPGTAVAIANDDAHVAVPAATVTEAGRMVMIMGTSICHMVLGTEEHIVPGMCGYVEDGIIPGFFGYEAGQSCVGDHFAWFVEHCLPAAYAREANERGMDIHALLEEKAGQLEPGESGLLAPDWWNGVPIHELVACGGLPEKNNLLMQIYVEVTGCPIRVTASKQTPALGSAMFGAVAAGASAGGYDSIYVAARKMARLKDETYFPIPEHQAVYDRLYAEYLLLHDYFGRGANDVMKRLKRIRGEVRSQIEAVYA